MNARIGYTTVNLKSDADIKNSMKVLKGVKYVTDVVVSGESPSKIIMVFDQPEVHHITQLHDIMLLIDCLPFIERRDETISTFNMGDITVLGFKQEVADALNRVFAERTVYNEQYLVAELCLLRRFMKLDLTQALLAERG